MKSYHRLFVRCRLFYSSYLFCQGKNAPYPALPIPRNAGWGGWHPKVRRSVRRVTGRAVGLLLFQRKLYRADYAFDVIHHIIIPKPNHFITLRLQICCSFFVAILLIQMLASIEFNNQFLARCTEVSNVLTDCMLSSETDSIFAHRAEI